MNKALFVGGGLSLLLLGSLMLWSYSRLTSTSYEGPLADHAIFSDIKPPQILLINQDNQPVSLPSTLSGEGYSVLSFVFTHCELVCPIMNGNVYRLTQEFAGQPVKFVGVSVDPVNDTPERLKQYLGDFEGVEPGVWTMLTGDPGDTESVVRAMGFLIEEDQEDANIIMLPNGTTMRNITHPVRFLVFDPQGRVVGSYRGNNPEEVDTLAQDLKRVLAHKGLLR